MDLRESNDAKLFAITLALLSLTTFTAAAREVKTDMGIRQQDDATMKWWQDGKFGMFIHWGLYAVPAKGEVNLYRPTIAREVPMKIERLSGFSATNAFQQSKARLRQTQHSNAQPTAWRCPGQPRQAWETFSFLLCQFAFGDECDRSGYCNKLPECILASNVPVVGDSGNGRQYLPRIPTISRMWQAFGRVIPISQEFTTHVAIPILDAR